MYLKNCVLYAQGQKYGTYLNAVPAVSMEYEKGSITKSIVHLDVALKLVWPYTSDHLSKALGVSFRESPGLFCRNKAIACLFSFFTVKESKQTGCK